MEVEPREEAEAGAPEPVTLEATARSLVAAEDVQAGVGPSFAVVVVGQGDDFEVDRSQEASASPAPADMEESWLAEGNDDSGGGACSGEHVGLRGRVEGTTPAILFRCARLASRK